MKHEYEQQLLSAILLNNNLFDKVIGILDLKYFEEENQPLWQKICDFRNQGKVADLITLSNEFDDEYYKYLKELFLLGATSYGIVDYAKLIYEKWKRQQIKTICSNAVDRFDKKEDSSEIISSIANCLDEVLTEKETRKESTDEAVDKACEIIEKAYQRKGVQGIRSGINLLDYKLGGFNGDELIVFAGRPAMGKTTIGLNLALESIKQKKHVVFFSLEMSKPQLMTRIVCKLAEVEVEKVRFGNVTEEEIMRIMEARTDVKRSISPYLTIFDKPSQTVAEIKAQSRMMKRRKKNDIIFIDHLGLINYQGSFKDNRVMQLTYITNSLKALTKELNLPIILLCQLNRAVESQEDKRPMLKDLRGSGSIEEDAESVIFIHRPEYYLENKEPESNNEKKYNDWAEAMAKYRNITQFHIAKNRNGSIGQVDVFLDMRINKMTNLERGFND
mgnify:CR=1 FL=1